MSRYSILQYLKLSHDWSSGICRSKIDWTRYLSICKCLEELEIQGGPSSLLRGITELSKLKSLILNHIDWDEDFSLNINTLFSDLDLNSIEYFGMSLINVSLENFMLLANRQCPNLKVICFRDCHDLKLDESALKTLISNFPKQERIHLLHTRIDLTDEQLRNFQRQSGVTIGLGYLYSFCELC